MTLKKVDSKLNMYQFKVKYNCILNLTASAEKRVTEQATKNQNQYGYTKKIQLHRIQGC